MYCSTSLHVCINTFHPQKSCEGSNWRAISEIQKSHLLMAVCQCHSMYLTGNRKLKSNLGLWIWHISSIYCCPQPASSWEGTLGRRWHLPLMTHFHELDYQFLFLSPIPHIPPCFCPFRKCKHMMKFVPYCFFLIHSSAFICHILMES